MKNLLPLSLSAVALFALSNHLHSQAPAPKSPMENLKALKQKNEELIQKQTQTLQKLDDLEKESEQIKAMGRRT
jgi:hypothetical protein